MTAKQPHDLSRYTVHMIGNAHIDPVWQWRWEEGRQEVLDTCRAAIDRILDTPGFIFCRSSAASYAWIEETDPELFAEIKRWVARGRWCVVNGWWEQPDCNVPGGEALVRQGLYGQRYFHSRFGVMAQTGWNVDTFGHAATLPQILRKQRLGSYCFFRPDPGEKQLPSALFWWQSPDGSRVLAARAPGHYCTWADEIGQRILDAVSQTPKGLHDVMCFYGVGNHGGGPTKANIASILQVQADPKGPDAIFSTPDLYFEKVAQRADKLPIVAEELQYHSRGCYTAVSAIKQHNRLSENLLLQAEKLAVLANQLTDLQYPAEALQAAWKGVLFNQFHDILAGTSIRPACDDAIEDYREAETTATKIARRAMTRVSAAINTAGPGRPIVVYNTLSWRRTEVVETEVTWPNQDDRVRMVDDAGEPIPFQLLHSTISGRGMTLGVAFLAEVPACGYRTYRMVPATMEAETPETSSPFSFGTSYLQTPLYRVEFDAETGYLTRLLDRRTGKDLLAGPANVPVVIDDPSDTWSHGVPAFREEIGRFRAVRPPQIVEAGPVRARMIVEMAHGDSRLRQDIRFYAAVPRIDVRLWVDYHGHHEFLKLDFPTGLEEPEATYEVPYGYVTRQPTGNEEPAQRWADVSGTLAEGVQAGLAVLNDAKYGYDVCEGQLRLSVLRTPIYCFHDPAKVDPRRRYEFTDQGVQEFTYALLPHAGDWREGDVVRQGQQLNHPCLLREEPAHSGALPPAASLAEIEAPNVILEVLKQQEDGRGWCLRAYETTGAETETSLRFGPDALYPLHFGPCEIKTLVLEDRKLVETDMLEWTES